MLIRAVDYRGMDMRKDAFDFFRFALVACMSLIASFDLTFAAQEDAEDKSEDADDEIASALDGLFGPRTDLTKEQFDAIAAEPLGSVKNPVRADMPAGQRAYLARLNCLDGGKPKFHRAGSVGLGPYGSIMDIYVVDCKAMTTSIYMDMYHPDYVELKAPEGFTIDPPGGDV